MKINNKLNIYSSLVINKRSYKDYKGIFQLTTLKITGAFYKCDCLTKKVHFFQ